MQYVSGTMKMYRSINLLVGKVSRKTSTGNETCVPVQERMTSVANTAEHPSGGGGPRLDLRFGGRICGTCVLIGLDGGQQCGERRID